jgi:hypothetical protein
MVDCSNGVDGPNVEIHYSVEFAALQDEKERFKGSKTMTQIVVWHCQTKNNSRDKHPQLEEKGDTACLDTPNRGIETPCP